MKHLCVLPFIHLSTKPEGDARYCCFAPKHKILKSSGETYNMGHDNIEDIWNADHVKNFRMRMINGEQPNECQICWTEEAVGKRSKRLRENTNYLENNLHVIEQAKNNDGEIDQLPIYLDLRPGNLCNLKCRSCNSLFSSKFANEVTTKWDKSLSFYAEHKRDKIIIDGWYQTETFWSNIEKILPNLEHVYISGGEPSIIRKIKDFLELCVSSGHAKHIKLRFNTNLMTFDSNFYNFLSDFKIVELGPSIDAYGERLTYIRHPLRWETVEKNLIKCLLLPGNIGININCVVSVMSILYYDELYLKMQELADRFNKEIIVSCEFLHEPEYLSMNILYPELKILARERNEKLFEKMKKTEKSDLKAALNLMDTEPNDLTKRRTLFISYTKQLDKIRKENFNETFPELQKMMES